MANTAAALDENSHKLVYYRSTDGPDGEIREKSGGKEIIKLIQSKTGGAQAGGISDIPGVRTKNQVCPHYGYLVVAL